ncbi:MAG: hypothetical protein E7418_00895 [Ruminococcaceae bacterium]|nr:hypothetical protein [Oscillospiraceae bacterium]
MMAWGWTALIIGALITFLAKPILQKKAEEGKVNEQTLYLVKIVGMWVVVAGAIMIFIAGGTVDVGAIR